MGKVAFDADGLGVGPPCFRVDSEEALLKRTDERALLARAAPGATPGRKLVTKSWIVGRRENTNGMETMEYVPQRTASFWMPFKQTCDEESDDADFDSFKTAPWDAGGTQRDKLHEVMCRAMVHNVDRSTTGSTKCEPTTKILVDTNCPRLEMTPGEGDASYRSTDWSAERHTFRRTLSVSVMYCLPCAVASLPADKLCTPLQRDDTVVCVEIDIPAEMNGTVIGMNDVSVLRRGLPQRQDSVEHHECYVCVPNMAVELNVVVFRRRRLPRTEFFAEVVEENYIAPRRDSVSAEQNNLTFRQPKPRRRIVCTEVGMNWSEIKGDSTASEPCNHSCRRRS